MQSQIQQAVVRILLSLVILVYLYTFRPEFEIYRSYILLLAALYIAGSLVGIPAIRRRPVSTIRTLVNPFIDIAMISFAMLIDGGHASGLYFLLLMIILGNGLRWGNALLAYCQALSVMGLVTVSIVTLTQMQFEINHGLLFWQIAGLIVIPLYVYLLGDSAKQAGEEQRQSENTSFLLLDQGPIPVFTFDLDDHEMPRIHYANAAINKVFRSDLTYLVGERPDILTTLEDGHDMLDFCRRSLQTVSKEPQIAFVRGKNRHGEILQLMCCATRLRWHNRWLGACYIIDITQTETTRSRLQEKLAEANVTALVSHMVHDFRNVLTKMMGIAEILQMESDSETVHNKLDGILLAGEEGSRMLSRMRQVSGKAGHAAPSADRKTARHMIENVIGLARISLNPAIQLHANIDEHLSAASASPEEIESMILCLLHHSASTIQAAGLIEVTVWPDARDPLARPGHPALGIRVSDNGSGMSEEQQQQLFDPFWTNSGNESNVGIELTTVRHMVDKSGGRIDINSSVGRGTAITIHLPGSRQSSVDQKTSQPGKSSHTEMAGAEAKASGRRILLVDDAPEVLTIHEALLKRLDFEVDSAPDGQQALKLFESSDMPYDLVITDFRMPKMNGLELATAIRARQPDVRILIITAYGEEDQLRRATAQGIRLLNKPVSLTRLEEVVKEVLDN